MASYGALRQVLTRRVGQRAGAMTKKYRATIPVALPTSPRALSTSSLLSSTTSSSSASRPDGTLDFFVNGKKHSIDGSTMDPDACLLGYLRDDKVRLTGSKMACGEGGCGACTVVVSEWDPESKKMIHKALNSCLTPLPSVLGKNVTTPEGVGNSRDGLHLVQTAMAESFGSQCGYCTPGFVMSLYGGLLNGKTTVEELEKCIDGNLCRCTGYRSIADAIHKIAAEASSISRSGNGSGNAFATKATLLSEQDGEEMHSLRSRSFKMKGERSEWHAPTSMGELLQLKKDHPELRIVSGGSEVAIEQRFQRTNYKQLASADGVAEMKRIDLQRDMLPSGDLLTIGGAVTLSELEESLKSLAKEMKWERDDSEPPQHRSIRAILNQIHWFSGTSVRNGASVAGNIATASPISDLNPVWVSLGARFVLHSADGGEREVAAKDFFLEGYRQVNMKKDEIISSIKIPLSSDPNFYIETFKQSPRREDDIATVTAALAVLLDGSGVVKEANLVYGGMAPRTISATEAETGLVGMQWDKDALLTTMSTLGTSMKLPENVPGGRPKYRTKLCQSFFFKFFYRTLVAINGGDKSVVPKEEQSGLLLDYDMKYTASPMSPGKVVYEKRPASDIVGQPALHSSAKRQVSGEAVYVDDIPSRPGELFAALVVSDRPHARVKKVCAKDALKKFGAKSFFSHQDIPGTNTLGDIILDEELFASDTVTTVGQPIGVVTAETPWAAIEAARAVLVEYEDLEAILSIEDAIEKGSYLPVQHTIDFGDAKNIIAKKAGEGGNVISGSINIGGQEHFYFEPNVTIATPMDSEMIIEASTQNLNKTQKFVAHVLGMPANRVQASVRRLGGGFGGKETQTIPISCAAAVAAHHEQRPVRLLLPRDQDMCITGKRHAFHGKYKATYDEETGRVEAVDVNLYSNAGNWHDLSMPVLDRAIMHSDNSYHVPNMHVHGAACRTNTISNTAYRGFGGPQGMLVAEAWIEHIAAATGIPPHIVRQRNLYQNSDQVTHYNMKVGNIDLPRLFSECMEQSELEARYENVGKFNKENRWRKRGISIVPSKFGIAFTHTPMNQASALVHVYSDGTVLVNHGGVEMGQGLHTKVLQIVAHTLEIPLDQVYLSDSHTSKIANASPTAASIGSDVYGMVAMQACQAIKSRLDVLKKNLIAANPNGPTPTWKDLVNQAFFERVSLSEHAFYKTPVSGYNFDTKSGVPFNYFTTGAACSEVEVDVLTGDHRVLRSDIVMDAGTSLNPMVDIGQIEGAFVQGAGWLTVEELTWGDKSHPWIRPGHIFSNGPGNYKIPSMDDAPREMNVTLMKDSPNDRVVHSSRGVGEPPLVLGSSVFWAIRQAIASARVERGIKETWFHVDAPLSAERIYLLCNGDKSNKGSW